MKYFTPDLLVRFGSDDDRIALAAEKELEVRSEEYLRQLNEIEDRLPPRFRELLERFYLHDARVIDHSPLESARFGPLNDALAARPTPGLMSLTKEERCALSFWIALELDTPPKDVLVLHYRSVMIDEAGLHQSLGEEECPYLQWQYDEVELIRTSRGDGFRHSILFTNGLELRLWFQDFDFATLKPIEITPVVVRAEQ